MIVEKVGDPSKGREDDERGGDGPKLDGEEGVDHEEQKDPEEGESNSKGLDRARDRRKRDAQKEDEDRFLCLLHCDVKDAILPDLNEHDGAPDHNQRAVQEAPPGPSRIVLVGAHGGARDLSRLHREERSASDVCGRQDHSPQAAEREDVRV